jgi:hypothetical protein
MSILAGVTASHLFIQDSWVAMWDGGLSCALSLHRFAKSLLLLLLDCLSVEIVYEKRAFENVCFWSV